MTHQACIKHFFIMIHYGYMPRKPYGSLLCVLIQDVAAWLYVHMVMATWLYVYTCGGRILISRSYQ